VANGEESTLTEYRYYSLFEAMVGLCLSYRWLRWRHRPSSPEPCPEGLTRTFVDTASGSLEIISAGPVGNGTKTPIVFAHGGMGSAFVWIEYLLYFGELGIPCYAVSLRGHGNSWYPSFLRMVWGTTKGMLADDLVAGIRHVEDAEGREVLLVGHSSGGGLSQLILSRGDVKVKGLGLLGAVPAFGSYALSSMPPPLWRMLRIIADQLLQKG
jgi:pimeloyl-ACP methyl ester carboxylesterase